MDNTVILTVTGLLIVNVLWFIWYFPSEGWRIVLVPLASLILAWRAIGGARRLEALRGNATVIKSAGRGFRLDLAHSHPRSGFSRSLTGVVWALTVFVGVSAAIVLYVLVVVRVARGLHLDFEPAWWIGGGCLFVLLALLAFTPLMQQRRGFAPVAIYVGLAGLALASSGVYKQYAINHARAECAASIAGVTDVHQRLQILASTSSCRER